MDAADRYLLDGNHFGILVKELTRLILAIRCGEVEASEEDKKGVEVVLGVLERYAASMVLLERLRGGGDEMPYGGV